MVVGLNGTALPLANNEGLAVEQRSPKHGHNFDLLTANGGYHAHGCDWAGQHAHGGATVGMNASNPHGHYPAYGTHFMVASPGSYTVGGPGQLPYQISTSQYTNTTNIDHSHGTSTPTATTATTSSPPVSTGTT